MENQSNMVNGGLWPLIITNLYLFKVSQSLNHFLYSTLKLFVKQNLF